jgi:hypothetical protein
MKASQRDWKYIRYSDINKSKPMMDGGISVHYLLSPSDVPSAWREKIEFINEQLKKITVEFKYLTSSEPVMTKKFSGRHVELGLGRNSHRLYRISMALEDSPSILSGFEGISEEVELDRLRERIGLVAGEVLDNLGADGGVPEGNAEAIKVIFDSGNDLNPSRPAKHIETH